MNTPLPSGSKRRFSLGGPMPPSASIDVWKFDAVLRMPEHRDVQATCFVRCVARGDALRAFFAAWPGATIFGTGMPLTAAQFVAEQSHPLQLGEVLAINEAGQVFGSVPASDK